MTEISSRTFNQQVNKAKKSALVGPVYITDRGKPSHVLLSYDDYQALIAKRSSIGELLAMPEAAEVAFSPGRLDDPPKAASFD